MYNNFNNLKERILDSLITTDLKSTRETLSAIKTPTIVTGVGGSKVVSVFTSKILERKNNIIAEPHEPRDIIYKNLSGYNNILACSYSGTNYGVQTSFNNELNHYLLSSTKVEGITNITYDTTYPKEKSFISLAATLIPMSIMLSYYLNGEDKVISDILSSTPPIIKHHPVYEIISGYETSSAHTYLESTMIEASLSIPIIHDKYSYCHGRTTTSYHNNHGLIYFDNDTELDKLMLQELQNYYNKIIRLKKVYQDDIVNDFYLTYISMLITKQLAEEISSNLSKVDYSPLVKKLYKYQGEM